MAREDKKPQESEQERPQKEARAQDAADKEKKGSKREAPAAQAEKEEKSSARSSDGRKNGRRPTGAPADRYVPRMKTKYLEEVTPELAKTFGYKNPMEVPHIVKVVVNIGMGTEARENVKSLDNAVADVGTITGQKALITRAKKSIAQFKLRTGMPIGVMVTLRGNRMYDFLDRLFNVALPRVRDFSGVSPSSFDGHGNFTLGLREQLIFPEIEYDKIDKIRGMEVVVVTTARTDEEGRELLRLLGMPFKRG